MKILPISLNYNQNSYKIDKTPLMQLKSANMTDTVSFGRIGRTTAHNAEALRALMAYNIPDIYSGKIVIERKKVEQILEEHVFSKSIKSIVKTIQPYEECLHDVEKEVFEMVKSAATVTPQAKLTDVIQALAPEHNKKLLALQLPIFDKLTELSVKLPEEKKKQFDEFMELVMCKLKYEPIVIPFNERDFQYKLKRIYEQVMTKNNAHEIFIMKQIMHIAKRFPSNQKEDALLVDNCQSKVKRNKKIMAARNFIKQRIAILNHLETLRLCSSLRKMPDLEKMFVTARSQIYGIPVTIAFNRKSFIEDLKNLLNDVQDTDLVNEMISMAVKLPTSHQNISAFIVKYANSSSEKIGYSLIYGSVGNIEHLIPYSKGGRNHMGNYAISSEYTNSERGYRTMVQQLQKHPEIYQNCPKQIRRLIELYNRGVFQKIGLDKSYIVNLANTMTRLAPPEKPLNIDLSALK